MDCFRGFACALVGSLTKEKMSWMGAMLISCIILVGCSAIASEKQECFCEPEIIEKECDDTYSKELLKENLDLRRQLEFEGTSFSDYANRVRIYEVYEGDDLSSVRVSSQVSSIALQLRGNTIEETFSNIYNWVGNNIEYNYYYNKRSTLEVLNTMDGDCTGTSLLMLELLEANGIHARKVHGYIPEKHDWIEVLYPLDDYVYWMPVKEGNTKIGDGFW